MSNLPPSPLRWRKATASQGSQGCVELATLPLAQWRKATRSSASGSDCVELASASRLIAIRDSKDPRGPKLLLDGRAWRKLADQVNRGELDL